MADIAFLVGALIPTFLLSRLFLFIMNKWNGGWQKVIFAHAVALMTITLIAGMGMANGGAFIPVKAFGAYILPQAIWLIYDLLKLRKEGKNRPRARAS